MTLKKLTVLMILCMAFVSAYNYSYQERDVSSSQDAAISKKIDTTHLTGINQWIAELYNEHREIYAVVVTLVMASLGSIMAFGTDLILRYFGMNVSKISHSE